MAETADDLSTPLGQETVRKKRRFRLPFSATQAIAVLMGLFLLAFLGFALFNDNPLGGEPGARVAIRGAPPGREIGHGAGRLTGDGRKIGGRGGKASRSRRQKTITIIDGSSGARHDVVVSGDAPDKIESDSTAPAVMAGIDQRLLEKSRYGMIPVAADGLKPFTAYAGGSDADRARAARMPVIAIVIGGLGVGAAKTSDAIMKLPPAVTLAFTPYGSDPGKLVERARAQRHEVLLQIPMEPFDYPDNDPGPQTLLTTLSAEQNLDRLFWHLSRFQGYAGIANFMGARFVVADAAMQPFSRGRQTGAGLPRRRLGAAQRRRPRLRRARRCLSPRPISASTRCRHRWKSTGRWRNSRVSRRSAERRSALRRRCRFRSSGSAPGPGRWRAAASCLCH